MSHPVVSVIIPTFNRRVLLERAVQSVLAQTFEYFELLIVDDGSTDDTRLFLERLRRRDPRVRFLVHEKNRGGSAARNTGIRAARGAYLAFLDSDDTWHPQKLERQVDVLRDAPANVGLIFSGHRLIDKEGTVMQTWAVDPEFQGELAEPILKGYFYSIITVLARREVFETVGLFDERLPSCQDWDMWIRVSKHYRMRGVPELLADILEHVEPQRISNIVQTRTDGYDAIARKHLRMTSISDRRIRSKHLFKQGRSFIKRFQLKAARRSFLRSFFYNPLHVRAAFYWGATFWGIGVFYGLEPSTTAILSLHKQHLDALSSESTTPPPGVQRKMGARIPESVPLYD